VPPAAIRNRSCRSPAITSDVKEDPDCTEHHHEARAAVRDERKRDSGQGSDAENRREVDRRLPADQGRDPRGEPLRERVAAGEREPDACVRERAVREEEQRHADQPELLADHRADHVRRRLGEVVERLDPLAEPAAEDPARAEADECLDVLEAEPGGVLPRVEEGEEAVAPVRRRPGGDAGEGDDDPVGGGEEREPRPRDEEDRADDEEDRERGAEVRLDEHQERERPDEEPDRAPELLEGARRRLPREIRREPEDDRELRELRRLEDERPDGDPAAGSVDPGADGEDAEAEDERRDDERRRDRAQPLEVEARQEEEESDAGDRVDRLPLDVALRVRVPERGRAGGRAVDHHEAEKDECGRDEDDDVPLELEWLGLCPLAHGSSSTRRRNVSPRSSKFVNWSKLAQAGDRTTTSPGSAAAAARAIAVARSPARS